MLSAEEKAACRLFRDTAQAALLATFDADPPTYTVPNFLALYRHTCAGRGGISSGLELKEMYVRSPGYDVFGTEDDKWLAIPADGPALASWTVAAGGVAARVPAGRFAFIYKQGTCRLCGQTARSRAGRLSLAEERPPLHGRVARG